MLTIGEVASRAGLSASAIRYYESQGLLPPAHRVGGRRVYQSSVLERLAVIALAKTAGFDLEEIRAVLSNVGTAQPATTWKTLAPGKRGEIHKEMRRLALMKHVLERLSACTCASLDECGLVFNEARAKVSPQKPLALKARRRLAARRLMGRRSPSPR